MTQPPQFPPPGSGYPVGPPPPSSGKATASLVLGILGLVVCPLVLSVPAIVLGRGAMREIDASGGMIGGRSSAQAGFWLGVVGTAWVVLAFLIVVAVFLFGSAVGLGSNS